MSSVAVGAGTLFSIPIDITAGNPLLFQMGVLEVINGDSLFVDPARLDLGGVPFPDNPFELAAEDVDGFQKNLTIRAHTDESARDYVILFSDELGNVYSSDFTIDTRPQGNAVTELMGRLLNRAGPAGTGGLDLDSGASTGSGDASAEIVDNGIDISIPNAENWLQTISGTNGVDLRYAIPGQNGLPGDYSFDNVNLDTEIAAAWTSSVEFVAVNSNNMLMSSAVNTGDLFVANKGGQLYLLVVREVNSTASDNDDNYVFDIKF